MSTVFNSAINELLKNPKLKETYDRKLSNIKVAREIRRWRIEAKLTQAELAESIGTKQPVIARLESAKNDSMPGLDTMAAIAHACGHSFVFGLGDIGLVVSAERSAVPQTFRKGKVVKKVKVEEQVCFPSSHIVSI